MTYQYLLAGNAYAEIETDGGGRPFALWPLDPRTTTPDRDLQGNRVYKTPGKNGGEVI
ncbi:hypothetical protein, partial [Escherichia coli]|uniref:hypothetical protein n=1 Tax=Escherichia coli TaxID=562 RepID=UPI003F7B3159